MIAAQGQVRIHVVDDDAALRTALARLLGASGYAVSQYDSAASFLRSVPPNEPGCILLDVNMPDLSGLQLQEHLGKVHSPLPIIFLTGHGDIAMSVRAIKAGADDFLAKPASREDLLGAIERALVRYYAALQQQLELRDMGRRVETLTPREHEVFSLVVLGLLNKQIAYRLGNTERTVKAHRHSVMEKMQVGSLAELVLLASRLGLLDNPADSNRPPGNPPAP